MECAAYECESHSSKKNALDDHGQPLIFHRFPEDRSLKSIWIQAMHMENWQPSEHSHLCSKHFTSDSYIKNSISLRKYAVPTIFEKYPNDVEQDEQEIKVEIDDITIEEEQFTAPPPPTTVFPSDVVFLPPKTFANAHEEEIALLKGEINILKRRLNNMTEVAKRRRSKIKALQYQLTRKHSTLSNGKGSATVLSIFKDYFVEFKSKHF